MRQSLILDGVFLKETHGLSDTGVTSAALLHGILKSYRLDAWHVFSIIEESLILDGMVLTCMASIFHSRISISIYISIYTYTVSIIVAVRDWPYKHVPST
jgi:hypothetical protein